MDDESDLGSETWETASEHQSDGELPFSDTDEHVQLMALEPGDSDENMSASDDDDTDADLAARGIRFGYLGSREPAAVTLAPAAPGDPLTAVPLIASPTVLPGEFTPLHVAPGLSRVALLSVISGRSLGIPLAATLMEVRLCVCVCVCVCE